jgi:O-antigen/teichoic acid export membrane protein
MLGEEAYGNYAFLLAAFGILSTVSNFGMAQSLRKFFPEERDRGDWKKTVVTFYVYLTITISILIVIFGLILIKFSIISRYFSPVLGEYLYFVLGWVVLAQMFSICRAILMASGNEQQSEPLLVLKQVLFLIAGISLLYLEFGIGGLMIGHIISTTIATFLGLKLSSNYFDSGSIRKFSITREQTRKFIKFSGFSALAIFLLTSLYQTDIVLVRYFLSSSETGYYKAALVSAEFLWFVPYAIQTIFVHSTSELWSKGDRQRITDLTSQATKYGVLLTILLAIGLASLSRPFISLYFGPNYRPAIMPLLILIPGAIGFAVVRPIYAVNYSKGDLKPVIYATGSAAFINIILNILLIPLFGMLGAALATSIGYGSMLIFHLQYAYSLGYNPTSRLKLGRIAMAAGGSALIIFGVARLINTDILKLIIVPPLGGFVFVSLSVMTGSITKTELITIAEKVR